MTASDAPSPFGRSIHSEDIVDGLGFFDSWEDRYRYLIELGRELPEMPEDLRNEANLVRGCQSQVWLDARLEAGRLQLQADSDAFIVRGLLAVILAAANNRPPREVLQFDMDGYLEQLDLLRHLSSTRGNGLRAMVQRIRDTAQAAMS
jgi:cysteine desulfuration protein SufE